MSLVYGTMNLHKRSEVYSIRNKYEKAVHNLQICIHCDTSWLGEVIIERKSEEKKVLTQQVTTLNYQHGREFLVGSRNTKSQFWSIIVFYNYNDRE